MDEQDVPLMTDDASHDESQAEMDTMSLLFSMS